MFIEWLWILAGSAFATGSGVSKICKRVDSEVKAKQMGYNEKRYLELQELWLFHKKEFNKLVGYTVEEYHSGGTLNAFEAACREIAYKEGWTYPGKKQRYDPDFVAYHGGNRARRKQEWDDLRSINTNAERQLELEKMIASKDPIKIKEFKDWVIHRNFNPDDPISVRVAIEEVARNEGWIYLHIPKKQK